MFSGGLNKQEYPSFGHCTTDLGKNTINGFGYLGMVTLNEIGLLGLETQAIWLLCYKLG